MYKNFTLTESEKEQILNMHKEHGYKQPINEQGVTSTKPTVTGTKPTVTGINPTVTKMSQSVGGPKTDTIYNKISADDPKYGKNIKQPESLIGKKATFYTNQKDAMDAYQAGKSNPQSEGSVIATIEGINSIDAKSVHLALVIDSAQSNYSTSRLETLIIFNRMSGTFTLSQPEKISGIYYSESVKNILNNEFFSTELASNNKPQQTNFA